MDCQPLFPDLFLFKHGVSLGVLVLAHSAGFEQLCSCCLSVGARVPSGLHPQLFLDTVELSSEMILLMAWFGKSYGVSLTEKQLGGGFLVTNLYLDGFLKLCWLLIYSFVSESTGSFLTVSLLLVTRQFPSQISIGWTRHRKRQ